MFSTPLTFCSSGRATVLTSVEALAPGYCVVTCTVGGTTFGYCEVGRLTSATSPMTTKNSARTLASTGRSMKKREIMSVSPAPSLRWVRSGRLRGLLRSGGLAGFFRLRAELHLLRIDLRAGDRALDALGHHPVIGTDAGFYDAVRPLALSRRDVLALDDIVRPHHQQIAPLLARPERHVGRENRVVEVPDRRAHPGEETGQQPPPVVVEYRAGFQRAGRCVHLGRGVVHMAYMRKAILALQSDLDRDAGEIRRPELDALFGVALLDPENLRLAHGEIDVDRVELDDRGELGRRP